eukprot:scaffold279115_cov41-Prasinocladus_malaysianus.AAC.1
MPHRSNKPADSTGVSVIFCGGAAYLCNPIMDNRDCLPPTKVPFVMFENTQDRIDDDRQDI